MHLRASELLLLFALSSPCGPRESPELELNLELCAASTSPAPAPHFINEPEPNLPILSSASSGSAEANPSTMLCVPTTACSPQPPLPMLTIESLMAITCPTSPRRACMRQRWGGGGGCEGEKEVGMRGGELPGGGEIDGCGACQWLRALYQAPDAGGMGEEEGDG